MSSPNHEGDHESRPTGSLQVHLGSAILENSARCSGDGDVSYRLLTSNRAKADRLDVRFAPQLVIWGGAAEDFEEIRDDPERTMQ